MYRYPVVFACFFFSALFVVSAAHQEKKKNLPKANNCLLYSLISLGIALLILEV